MTELRYHHVDVFSRRPFSGNSLSVFTGGDFLTSEQMLAITQEMRHFESIFLKPTETAARFRARVFDLERELDFAGHPLIGAASVVHSLYADGETAEWVFDMNHKTVTVATRRVTGGVGALLDPAP